MGMKTIVFYGLMAIAFMGMSIAILVEVNSKNKAWNFNRYQSLHPMQAPFDIAYNFALKDFTSLNILISDLSTVSFNTPGLPSRLASAAHIGMMLHEPAPLPSIVYPIVDNTTKSRLLFGLAMLDVKMKDGAMVYNAMIALLSSVMSATNRSNATVTVNPPGPGNTQDMFTLQDALTLKQTDYYCPIRGPNTYELYEDWIKRTEQPHDTFDDKYKTHMEFSYTSVHEKKCHAQRPDSMVMAHVAPDLYSVFSTHSTGSLLLGVTLLGFAFVSFAGINLLYRKIDNGLQGGEEDQNKRASSTQTQEAHRKREMQLHTLTTLLKLVCVIAVVVFLGVEYMYKTDYADWTKNKMIPTSSFLCVFCSTVLAFLILYMHGPSKMIGKDHRMNREITDYCNTVGPEKTQSYLNSMGFYVTDVNSDDLNKKYQNVMTKRGLFPSLDLIREKIESEKEVLMYSYSWFVTVPLFFMAMYADRTYGVDLHMQLIVLAVMVGCAIDILYTRMAMIIDVVWDIYIKNLRDDKFDTGTAEEPSQDFKEMIIYLKVILWILFLAVRFTIIIIPYMLFAAQCTMNCDFIKVWIVIFEVSPVIGPLVDQLRTWQNKSYDFDDLSSGKTAQAVGGVPSEDKTTDRKYESMRVTLYCVMYYGLLVIASVTFCAQHLAQKIQDNDARLDVWSAFRAS